MRVRESPGFSPGECQGYVSGQKTVVKVLITSGPGNTDTTTLFLSGVAMVPNQYGLIQHPALSLHWGLNGEASGELTWHSGNWNSEGLAYVNANTTMTVHVKVMDNTKDVFVTFHEHNGGWHGGSPYITVGTDTTVFRPDIGFRSVSSKLYQARMYIWPRTIRIPASIVQAQVKTSAGGVPNVLPLKIKNTQHNNWNLRGIDTEIAN